MNLSSWDHAKELVSKWNSQGFIDPDLPQRTAQFEISGLKPSLTLHATPTGAVATVKNPAIVEEAIERFFINLHTRRLSPATLKKYRVLLEKQLITFCQLRGFRYIEQLGINELDDFVASLKDSPISTIKKMERLSAFFRWCQ